MALVAGVWCSYIAIHVHMCCWDLGISVAVLWCSCSDVIAVAILACAIASDLFDRRGSLIRLDPSDASPSRPLAPPSPLSRSLSSDDANTERYWGTYVAGKARERSGLEWTSIAPVVTTGVIAPCLRRPQPVRGSEARFVGVSARGR